MAVLVNGLCFYTLTRTLPVALERVQKLQRDGIGSALVFEAPYYKVIAGSFANVDGAKERLKAVRRVQLDTFIRSVQTDQGVVR